MNNLLKKLCKSLEKKKKENLKSVLIKFTMSKPVKIDTK